MSFTDLGTLMLDPFRSLSREVLRLVLADWVFSTTFSATFCPLPTAFSLASLVAAAAFVEVVLAFAAAFFVVDLALLAAFFATSDALLVAFLAAFLVPLAALAAVKTFFATAAERPAFCKSPRLAFANLATVPNLAAVSFFAVAAPTPGNDVMPESLDFFAMVSPITTWARPNLNLPAPNNGAWMRFLHVVIERPRSMEGMVSMDDRGRRLNHTTDVV